MKWWSLTLIKKGTFWLVSPTSTPKQVSAYALAELAKSDEREGIQRELVWYGESYPSILVEIDWKIAAL